MKRKLILIAIFIATLFLIVACGKKGASATIIIIGRHANANEFADVYYSQIARHIRDAYQNGGYVRLIVSDGSPRQTEHRFVFYLSDEPDRMERARTIDREADRIVQAIKNTNIRATTAENDLLEALHVARRVFNELDLLASGDNEFKRISNRKIIIMDTGIVTAGALDFTAHGFERPENNLRVSDEKIQEFANGIADRLQNARQLPNLAEASVVFLGFGDVAEPQTLSKDIEHGLRIFWKEILSRCNISGDVEMPELEGKREPILNVPPVRHIKFTETIEIDNRTVNFVIGTADYSDPTTAVNFLRNISTDLKNMLTRNPTTKLYLIGSESENRDRRIQPYYTTELSQKRAETVMNTLISFGVSAHSLEAFGLHVELPGRLDDRPNGVYDPSIGALNQKVIIIPSDIGDQAFLREVLDTRDKLYGRG